jgi:hypothetical protein
MVLEVRPAHSALSDGASASSATSEEEDDDDADELTMDPLRRKGDDGMRRLRVDRLLESVLQDAQTRLFFKAQAVLHADVRGFVPKADDLAYPAKLIGAPSLAARSCFLTPSLRGRESACRSAAREGGTHFELRRSHEVVRAARRTFNMVSSPRYGRLGTRPAARFRSTHDLRRHRTRGVASLRGSAGGWRGRAYCTCRAA